MYFKQIDEIVSGTKTQTRRIVKPGEWLAGGPFEVEGKQFVSPVSIYSGTIPNERLKWQVGRDYAVSPGRGKPGVWWHPGTHPAWKLPGDIATNAIFDWQPLRIRITAIRRESLQDITPDDARAEGKPHEYPWTGPVTHPHQVDAVAWYRDLWERINGRGSWDANPDVWVLEFEVVRSKRHEPQT
jgi:hypothetical protein